MPAPPQPRARPRVGSLEWERAGGPPLSFGQKLRVLAGRRTRRPRPLRAAAALVASPVAITTNLNAFVPQAEFGPEAHFMVRRSAFSFEAPGRGGGKGAQ